VRRDSAVLIDSSVWIDYLRYKPPAPLVEEVNELILEEKAVIIPPILYEILVGARNEVVYDSLRERFSGVSQVEISATIWEESARLGFSLRRKGLVLPTTDVIISAAAIHYGLPILHADRHFDMIAKHSSLKILPRAS